MKKTMWDIKKYKMYGLERKGALGSLCCSNAHAEREAGMLRREEPLGSDILTSEAAGQQWEWCAEGKTPPR